MKVSDSEIKELERPRTGQRTERMETVGRRRRPLPSSVEAAGGVKELKTPDERLMKELQIRWPTSVGARKPEKILISPQTLCDIKSAFTFLTSFKYNQEISAIFALQKV